MITTASIIGRSHRLMHQNCHDFTIAGQPTPTTAFGIVLDGCGSKYRAHGHTTPSHNEVGANLLGHFIANWLHQNLSQTQNLSTKAIHNTLFNDCITFLKQLTHSLGWHNQADQVRFVASHLLCTIVGFVKTSQTAVFFWRGDGYLCCNNDINTLNSNNQPDYLAYALTHNITSGFNLHPIADVNTIERLGVATDGWHPHLLTQLTQPQSSVNLQRWLNVQARQQPHFEDDGAIALWYKTETSNKSTQQNLPDKQLNPIQ